MTTPARQLRRLQEQLADAQGALANEKGHALRIKAELEKVQERLANHQPEVRLERARRIWAQYGFCDFLRTPCRGCGQSPVELGVKIAYDPEQDPLVQEEVRRGLLPSRHDSELLRQIARSSLPEMPEPLWTGPQAWS